MRAAGGRLAVGENREDERCRDTGGAGAVPHRAHPEPVALAHLVLKASKAGSLTRLMRSFLTRFELRGAHEMRVMIDRGSGGAPLKCRGQGAR